MTEISRNLLNIFFSKNIPDFENLLSKIRQTFFSPEVHFLVGKDESGWVRVQRLKSKEEGYVPASYTSLPTTTR